MTIENEKNCREVYVLLADGFEESEAIVPTDYLLRAGITTKLVSTTNELTVAGSHDIKVIADQLLTDTDPNNALAVVIPGGLPGATSLRDNEKVIEFVKRVAANQHITAAICAGPIVLEKAGLLTDKNYSCFPGWDKEISSENWAKGISRDGNVITAEGPAFAPYFGLALVKALAEEKLTELNEKLLATDLKEYLANNAI